VCVLLRISWELLRATALFGERPSHASCLLTASDCRNERRSDGRTDGPAGANNEGVGAGCGNGCQVTKRSLPSRFIAARESVTGSRADGGPSRRLTAVQQRRRGAANTEMVPGGAGRAL